MEASTATRPSLPPIKFLETDTFRREQPDYQTRPADTAAPAKTPVSAPSYTQAPPPYTAAPQSSYATQPQTNGSFSDQGGKAPEARDAKESAPSAPIPSLPSLSEALGVDRNPQTPQSRHGSGQSLESPRRLSGQPSPQHAPPSFASQGAGYPPDPHARYPPNEPSDYRRRDHPDQQPQPYQRMSPPEAHMGRPLPPGPDRHYDGPPGAPPPPGSQFSFGYAPPPGPYTSAPPVRPPVSAPSHPSAMAPPGAEQSQGWRPGPPPQSIAAPPPRPPQAYGESVKRHLDLYDFELALNEIREHSTITLDFSRQYGARLHQVQRSGVVPGTLPAITEVEDLMNKSRGTLEALGRLREVLVAQQAAYFQQAQEHHQRLDQDAKRSDTMLQQDQSKTGGFVGSEPKKRRGRNAAPGRCHSCNRAETPEWRRGPDGARTLCNACGLHYAKLTRKNGAAKAAMASSSLRPKGEDGADM